jgi:uncharacterized protein YjbI with pentapeptide repeats
MTPIALSTVYIPTEIHSTSTTDTESAPERAMPASFPVDFTDTDFRSCIEFLFTSEGAEKLDKIRFVDDIVTAGQTKEFNQFLKELEESGQRADLSGIDFSYIDCSNINFGNACLEGSTFQVVQQEVSSDTTDDY